MNRRHFYAILLASSGGAASAGFFLGRNYFTAADEKNTSSPWLGLVPPPLIRRASADASSTTLVLQPPAPSIPSGPVELHQDQTMKTRIEDLELWKKPSRAAEIMCFGYPGFDNLRTYEDFIVSYDRRHRTAHWVVEHLSPERMTYNPEVDRSKCIFRPDTSIHPFFQSQNEDYRGSGYDRGHLAAAANHRRTQLSIEQTFFLTNMSPQVGKGFNRDKWNDLEKHVRHLARKNPNVFVCTGPLYLPQPEADGCFYVKYKVIGNNRVAVPTHFFKVVLIETAKDQFEMEVYLMPNAAIPDEKPLADFFAPLDAIERAAGFLIFEKLPKEWLKKVNGRPQGGGGVFRLFG